MYEQHGQRLKVSDVLYEMSRLSQSSSLVAKNLLHIVESISRIFGFERMLLASYDNTSKKFIANFVIGFSEDDSKKIISTEIDIDPMFFSVSSVKVPIDPVDYFKIVPVNSDICRFVSRAASETFESHNIEQYMLMPMMAFGKLFGVIIALRQNVPHNIPHADLKKLAVLVQVATIISENLQLKAADTQKMTKMTTLYEISQQTKNIIRPADALGSLVDIAKSLIDYNTCALYVPGEKTDELLLKEYRGDDPSFMGNTITLGQGPVGEAAQTKAPQLSHYGIYKSFLAIPIIIDEKLIGVMAVGSLKSYAYNEDDKITMKILTTQVASIDNLFSTLVNMRTYTDSIMESMPLGIITVDTNGNVNVINQTAKLYLNLTKYAQEEIIGKKFDEILEGSPNIVDIFNDSLSKGFIFENFEIFNERNDMNFEITTFQFKNADGQRLGIAMFMRDITRMRQMEEHIRRTDRLSAVGELASGVAHEIRNPLTGIKMMIQILDKEFEKKGEKNNKYTRTILEEIDRLDNIISNLLNFARPSKPEFSDTSIIDVIESTLFLLKSKIDSQDVKIQRNYPEIQPSIKCDAAQIKQVLFNICQNALQSMKDKDVRNFGITISGDNSGTSLAFSDTGCGIPRDYFKQIFNPFFTTKDNGTGLGLSIVHRILEEHKGSVTVESEIDKGSTFTIWLPK